MTFQPMTTEGRIQVITVLALEALGLARDHGVDDCKDGCSGDAARIHDALMELSAPGAVTP